MQNFINAAARLHRARRREMAVHLEKKFPFKLLWARLVQPRAHIRNLAQGRLDEAVCRDRLGELDLQEGSEAGESACCVFDLRTGKRKGRFYRFIGLFGRVYPENFFAAPDRAAKCRLLVAHGAPPVLMF